MAQIVKRGESWMARVFLGRDTSGKRQEKSKSFPTKKTAVAWARDLEKAAENGGYVEPTKQTLGEYLAAWLDGAAKQQVRPQTLRSYRQLLTLYVLPELGDVPLARLQLARIDRLYAEMSARGLSPRTVRYTHAILRRALSHAVRSRLIPFNPADHATLPRQQREEMRFLDAEQSRAFLEASAEDEWHALWVVLLTTGMRPSEAMALRWDDWQPGQLRVRRTMQRHGGAWRFDECKTGRSRRTVTVPASVDWALRMHRGKQDAAREKAGAAWQEHGLIFANAIGCPPDLRSIVRNHFDRVLQGAGLPSVRLYDLRHSHASALLAAGVPVSVVSERLGHASAKMTLDVYAHVTAAQHEQVADTVGRLFA